MDNRPPPPHVSPKGVWVSKLILRIFSAISCLVLIGLGAGITARWGYTYRSSSYAGYTLAAVAPPACIAFIWDVAEGICIIARRGHRGIHPGAVVAVDLLLWLGYVAGIALFGVMALYDLSGSYSSSYYYDFDELSDFYDDHYVPLRNMSHAILAFGIIEVILHLTLFIFGCCETNIRNRQPAVVYFPGGAPMGHMSMPPNQYGQQPIMLPAGQAPPAGYVAYAYGPTPTQPQPVHQQPEKVYEHYAPEVVSPPPQEPSPVQSNSNPPNGGADWRNSYQPSSIGASPQDTTAR